MTGVDISSRLVCSSEGTLYWGCPSGGTSRRESVVTPLHDESDWVINSSTLAAPDLLRRGIGGGNFFDNTGGRDGPFDDPSPFLVFGGMVFVSFCSVVSHRRRQTVGAKNDTHLVR